MKNTLDNSAEIINNVPNLGNHLILDFFGVEKDINDYSTLDTMIRGVLKIASATIENSCFKQFSPQGITILYLLSESHFSIHTWPEKKALTIDFYHCGSSSVDNFKIVEEQICDFFGWEHCTSTLIIRRGQCSSLVFDDYPEKSEILHNVKFLHREKSEFQDIRVYETLSLGRILVLDGIIQISSYSLQNDNYTKDICNSIIKKDRIPNDILIIGGGDLIIASYILENFPEIDSITVCEIDNRVIEVSKQYFPVSSLINNGRLIIKIGSGFDYIKQMAIMNQKIGAVIVDCTDFALDEDSLAAELYSTEFYSNLYQVLEIGSCFSQQFTKPHYRNEFEIRARSGGFNNINVIVSITPEYGGEVPIAICTK